MTERLHAEVVHAVPPEELADADPQPALRSLAAGRHVLVCREGGAPSWLDRITAFLFRRPIEAVTVVADDPLEEGVEFRATVEETSMAGVYDATSVEPVN
ncbi:MAG: hypothetical protein ABEJ88_09995 [Halobacterium sp.]